MSAKFVVVMGVSGSGKSTLARGLAYATDWPFAEGDDFHPKANVDKMAAGTPLTDEDRWPWLRSISEWMTQQENQGQSAIITCSALKRTYRDLLRQGHPGVQFAHVDVPRGELVERVTNREGHYMPASLLDSQLDTLEPLGADEPGVVLLAIDSPGEELVQALGVLQLPVVNEMPPPPGALEAVEEVGPYRNV